MVFCVFNWHDELLRAQMDDDWTANIVCVCVLFACYLSLEERLPKQNQNSHPSQKERFFDDALLFGALGTAKRTLFLIRAAPPKESQKV